MNINNILAGVESFDIVLPEFQREYVWRREDAKQLIISLYKNYPTGSLLFWKANGENIPELKGKEVDKTRIGSLNVILDGQQRITTLYLLLKGKIPPYYTERDIMEDPRNLFFNLETGEFQYYMKMKMEGNPLWQRVVDCFDLNKVNAVDVALICGKARQNEIDDWNGQPIDTKLLACINGNLVRLLNISQSDYHVQTVPHDAKIDEAIDIFDRVNSQGTKLTDAELVLTHITGKWPDARRTIKAKIQQLADKEKYSLDLNFFTRCFVVALTDSALFKKNTKLNYENFSKEDYIKSWNDVSRAIDYLIPILKYEGHFSSDGDFSTTNVLVPIIAHLMKREFKFTEATKNGFLYWMNLALIWSRYSGQTNERLDKDVYLATASDKPGEELVKEVASMRGGRIEVRPDDLEGRDAAHPLYRALYIVTKHNKAIDWANGAPIQGVIGDIYSIQSHHIFPQNFLHENGYDSQNHLHNKLVNEIANRAFITRDGNYCISNKDPCIYLPKVEEEYPGALEKQFIPMNETLWQVENYQAFLRERRKNIAHEVNGYLKELKRKSDGLDIVTKTDWKAVISKGESDFAEFKQSLRWDSESEGDFKKSEYIALKNFAALMNSNGGRLFIGVADSGEVTGIESDYQTFDPKKIGQNADGFRLHLDNLIKNYLGDVYHTYLSIIIEKVDGKDVCIVDVARSDMPVFLKSKEKGETREEFFIRRSASTVPLSLADTVQYTDLHWAS